MESDERLTGPCRPMASSFLKSLWGGGMSIVHSCGLGFPAAHGNPG